MSSNGKDSSSNASFPYDYDLIVIGGGSGGLQLSKQAADLGAKVALLDFVKPSTQHTTWGVGGTCVNVGCIPKKLMHFAAQAGEKIQDSVIYGWNLAKKDESTLENVFNHFPHEERSKHFDWNQLVQEVQNTVKGSNFVYKKQFRQKGIKYMNALGRLVDRHTVETVDKKGKKQNITGKYITIATGGRPHIPQSIEGALKYGITSDDLFSLNKAPGKTVVIGASYISLECAGFLHGFGYDTTVIVRSRVLRSDAFDRESTDHIFNFMKNEGVNFVMKHVPVKVEPMNPDEENDENKKTLKKRVHYKDLETGEVKVMENVETVLFATGRKPDVQELRLAEVGVKVSESTGKIIVDKREQTSVDNIFAIGDIIENGYDLELTPVAITTGKNLSHRLFKHLDTEELTDEGKRYKESPAKYPVTDYANVATTVFTPIEYGKVGYSEEKAVEIYGRDKLKIYKKKFNILEFKVPQRLEKGFVKVICLKDENEKVVGMHFVGNNAGEVIQGFSLAVKLGITKEDLDNTIGIHPTDAESFVYLVEGIEEDESCCG